MRIRSVLLGTAFLLTTATGAAAQGATSPRAFVGGLGGLTFGTATSSAIAGQVGVRISRDLFVIGELGRMWDVTPSEISDQIETGIDFLEQQGIPVNLEFSVPAFYGFGGIRWAQSGRRVAPFVEGGVGFARLTAEVSGTIAGINVDEFLEELDSATWPTSRPMRFSSPSAAAPTSASRPTCRWMRATGTRTSSSTIRRSTRAWCTRPSRSCSDGRKGKGSLP